jgi:hypothetical protein
MRVVCQWGEISGARHVDVNVKTLELPSGRGADGTRAGAVTVRVGTQLIAVEKILNQRRPEVFLSVCIHF